MSGCKDYIAAIAREIEEWPGAEVNFALSARHQIAELRFNGRTRRHYFPSSPSDVRGIQNCLGDIRRALKGLGAWRTKQATSPYRNRTRNKPERGLPTSLEPAPVMPSPFEALAQLKKELPMTRQIEINGKTITLETGKTPAPLTVLRGRKKGAVRLLCEAMRPGESAFLPVDLSKNSTTLTSAGKALGLKFALRREGAGSRVYCLAPDAVADTPKTAPVKLASGW